MVVNHEYNHCEEVFVNDLHQTTRRMRQAIVHYIYFHGEYEQFLTLIARRGFCYDRMITFEFPVVDIETTTTTTTTTTATTTMVTTASSLSASQVIRHKNSSTTSSSSSSSSSTIGDNVISRKHVLVDYSNYKSYEFNGNQQFIESFQSYIDKQKVINQQITTNYMKVEFERNKPIMLVYDLTMPSVTTENESNFKGHDRYDVSGSYAFTSDGKFFAYVDEWEDGDQREEPDVMILRMRIWKERVWERRCHVMMFLAGYGLLKVFQKKVKDPLRADELETVLTFDTTHQHSKNEQHVVSLEEESSSVKTLFRVLHCPNLLQQLVYYI